MGRGEGLGQRGGAAAEQKEAYCWTNCAYRPIEWMARYTEKECLVGRGAILRG